MIRIVICDDEINIRQGLKRAVEQMGHQFQVSGLAANGREAYQMIQAIKPDLVLMDINMPEINGLEIIEALSTQQLSTKYILISGDDDFCYVRKALRLGALDYLLKPIDRDELYLVISQLADKREMVQETKPMGLAGKIRIYIENNYQCPEITLSSLAKQFHASESYVTRMIKKECGKSYTEFINSLRLEKAKRILESDDLIQSQQVAERVGYLNKHYFCRIFKQYTGKSPIEYQKNTLS